MNALEIVNAFEQPCPTCKGEGWVLGVGQFGNKAMYGCDQCGGKKIILTEAGEAFVEFMKRQLEKQSPESIAVAIQKSIVEALQ